MYSSPSCEMGRREDRNSLCRMDMHQGYMLPIQSWEGSGLYTSSDIPVMLEAMWLFWIWDELLSNITFTNLWGFHVCAQAWEDCDLDELGLESLSFQSLRAKLDQQAGNTYHESVVITFKRGSTALNLFQCLMLLCVDVGEEGFPNKWIIL